MATEANKCSKCRWYRVCGCIQLTRQGRMQDVFLGACRATAPGRNVTGWPTVLEDDECGEWREKPSATCNLTPRDSRGDPSSPNDPTDRPARSDRGDKPRGPAGGGDRMAFDGDVSMEEE
jgi:hypothetical protein